VREFLERRGNLTLIAAARTDRPEAACVSKRWQVRRTAIIETGPPSFSSFSYVRALSSSFVVCFLTFSAGGFGQPLSFGVIGGASLTQDFQNSLVDYSTSRRWTAGAVVEVRLPSQFSVEVDGLYHELGFTAAPVELNGTRNILFPASVVTWEVPALAKYRFSRPAVKPFIEAGPSFRASANLNGASPSSYGLTLGAGVEVRLWRLNVAPQVRYLRWARDNKNKVSLISPFTNPNQAELLVGLLYVRNRPR
jgi:hypothetical protein